MKSGYDTNLAAEFYVLCVLHRLGIESIGLVVVLKGLHAVQHVDDHGHDGYHALVGSGSS